MHVFRPNRGNLMATMEGLEAYMLWGEGSLGSWGREWVGTLVNGGIGGDVNVGWRGWLRVEREGAERGGFGAGVSVDEAVTERKRRADGMQAERDKVVGWRAVSDVGVFTWKEK